MGKVPGARYTVTGSIAGNHDFAASLRDRAPLVFALQYRDWRDNPYLTRQPMVVKLAA